LTRVETARRAETYSVETVQSRRDFRQRVGERIRARRLAARLSQRQLARRLSDSLEGSQVSRWERGLSFPSYGNVVALARALDVSEELLLCGCANDEHRRRAMIKRH
jgi:transcriptional regulator with XRE-family HTH domain